MILTHLQVALLSRARWCVSTGKFIAIGFMSGVCKILVGMTLEEVCTFKASKGCITHTVFSSDSTYLATADTDECVGVFRLGTPGDEASAKKEWLYVGKYRGHYRPITGLQFGEGSDGSIRLFSLGEDRSLVEYDRARSSIQGGVQLRNTAKVEQTAVPTGCLFLPPMVQGAEPAVITANDQYKLRVVAPGSKSVQRTVVGPTYGGPLTKMILLRQDAAVADASDPLCIRRRSRASRKGMVESAGRSFREGTLISGSGASANALAAMSGSPNIRSTWRMVSTVAARGRCPR